MKRCPYCEYSNYDNAIDCRKCEASLIPTRVSSLFPVQARRFESERARGIRKEALAAVALGLMIEVYWGGYGPWPVVDYPQLAQLRAWLEPLFLGGGAVGYAAGLIMSWM